MGIFLKTKAEFDFALIKPKLLEALTSIEVPEFNASVAKLDLVKNMTASGNKLLIDLVLPTFALRSERDVATKVKQAAIELVPSFVEVELNVFADVKPVVKQSLNKENIANVKNVILVASGKGGVGKSTVASNLAAALAHLGCRVGLLDADVYGPSIPTMFGVPQNVEIQGIKGESEETTFMLPVSRHGVKLMSIGFLVDTSSAMIWRGPMIASAFMQMFYNVAWGDLDYLIVDLPPGTGDIQLTIAQKVVIAGSVIVSTPQDVALADVIRAKSMFDKVNIPSLGVVENMSYFVCDGCDKRHEIFTHGGAHEAANKLALPFLGEVPLEVPVRQGGDEGQPSVLRDPKLASSQAFIELAHELATRLAIIALQEQEAPTIRIIGESSEKPAKRGLPVL